MSLVVRSSVRVLAFLALASCAQLEVPGSSRTNQPPNALMVADPFSGSASAPVTVAFSGSGSYDEDGSVVRYDWSVDGASYSGPFVEHTFDAPGWYEVRLEVQDDQGGSARISRGYLVDGVGETGANQPPHAVIETDPASGSAAAPVTVTFSGSDSYDEDGAVVEYAWTIDGESYEGVSVQHAFDAPGWYQVELLVRDGQGGAGSSSRGYFVLDSDGGGADDPPSEDPAPEPDPEPEPSETFDITLVFYGSHRATPSQQEAFRNAAARWAEVIAGDLPYRDDDIAPGACFGRDHPSHRERIDDLLIFASVEPMDGPDGTLAAAGPCRIRSGTNLPYVGLMEFDEADVAQLESEGLFEATVLHEMGHVLGIGTVWEYGEQDLVDPVGSRCRSDTRDARFNGAEGTRQHEHLGGSGKPHVETDYGDGTACGHWDEDRYGDELMTGLIDRTMPLSRMTVGSLQDLGYRIDYATADDYRMRSGFGLQAPADGRRIREVLLVPEAAPD